MFNNVKYVINSFYSLSYADDTIFALSWLDIKIEEFFFANRFNRRWKKRNFGYLSFASSHTYANICEVIFVQISWKISKSWIHFCSLSIKKIHLTFWLVIMDSCNLFLFKTYCDFSLYFWKSLRLFSWFSVWFFPPNALWVHVIKIF